MTTIYGYLRLSDEGMKHFDEYVAELKKNGATEIVTDRPTPYHRPNFYKLIANSSAGDTVVVIRESHLSSNLTIAEQLESSLALNQIRINILDTKWVPINESEGADHGGNGH